jgi:GNAT superfamily N-acetyltransferase
MISYRFADIRDLNLLVSLRIEFLHVAVAHNNYQELKSNIEAYFKSKLLSKECTIILAESEANVIGTGIMFYYASVPSVFNITGKNEYITSMYVDEKFRRQNIGTTILLKLLKKAKEENYKAIMLNASEMGRKLYEKCGFIDINNSMIFECK